MKKFAKLIAAATAVVMSLACAVSAGTYDDVVSGIKFTELSSFTVPQTEMRGFGVDPNGKYLYGGLLQNGPTVYQFNTADGKQTGTSYTFKTESGAYIKAIGADDRGYVYMGIANAANNGAVYFAICEENGLNEVSNVKIDIAGKVGVNGSFARKIGDKYYMYLVTNYDTDRIYRYDVTDVKNPVLDTTFGNNAGYTDLAALGINDANNVAVADDGSIFLATKMAGGSKGDTFVKLDSNAKAITNKNDATECYGAAIIGEYVATSSYKGAKIMVFNQSDLSLVKEYTYSDANAVLCNLGMGGDKLYVGDQNSKLVVSTAIAIPEPVVETPVTDSAATSDAGLAVAALMLAAGACFVVARKKH
ncbi:MAG: hypothetical protein HFE63_07625 [Clostridiales bacterium]|nr:hypothetical protein [Clostridiales bacterium]